jgi:hypothetical protein
MRRKFTYAEHRQMIQNLRAHAPEPSEGIDSIRFRIFGGPTISKPTPEVAQNVLAAAGFYPCRARIEMAGRSLLKEVRNLRAASTFRLTYANHQIERDWQRKPQQPSTGN